MSFVLIHGAGFGADCWDELIPHLSAEALAVDLPGRGTRAGVPLGTVTLSDCADAVREDVEARGLREVVLVGHSFAGSRCRASWTSYPNGSVRSSSCRPSYLPTEPGCSTRLIPACGIWSSSPSPPGSTSRPVRALPRCCATTWTRRLPHPLWTGWPTIRPPC
ncbi:alpha/beta fold hydrolase [Streptomyces rapamycinicus]|uniref:alpha/beta fold hydrolase n=1 Tax=Streptomyces rapamycinicus TaxID=1226757 RepID=UPI002209BBAA|nr:alpha/beta fold hydrolase [Streptomyces rapamycinicus NRRL 5491]